MSGEPPTAEEWWRRLGVLLAGLTLLALIAPVAVAAYACHLLWSGVRGAFSRVTGKTA